jgi:hypothetical protein
MNMMEIERALRTLRLSGIRATLDTRIVQAQARSYRPRSGRCGRP